MPRQQRLRPNASPLLIPLLYRQIWYEQLANPTDYHHQKLEKRRRSNPALAFQVLLKGDR
ncbi:hypothetical protein H6F93_21105 [Leptolyngbya sp. FACHB-671]|uniref:hypothetical protein n=1 Tax=Leptolyngbya sp. FACHB-671 TaxID=2692812 RepID=UPI0016824C30|nr:hypothetical protein [Leptolyngbya sp. FACHB-671]MBD2069985.1 hypothetical protein [Leptolyngbya sp. FACHB-671]